MALPSLQRVVAEAARVVRRFPLTLLSSLVLCVVGIYWQRLSSEEEKELAWLFPVVSAAGLGLALTLCVALAAERYRWPRWAALAGQAAALALLALWYAVCPAEPDTVWSLRLLLLLLALHLLVAAVPYLPELRRQADTPGFWRYNETLFLRILTAGLYSGVLYAGCALAMLAVENLFDIKLGEHSYEHLFTVLGTVFNTWFFLAGVPADFAALEQEAPYPKGLKMFTQFVLLPLVVLYLGILYAYLGRILGQWQLPKGWVSLLVLAFSVAGIFALLLIHPIRHAAENTWIRTFARWFYRALFPLLGLLAVAIGTRVRQYGLTEERYFVLILAGWLALVAIYFLMRRGQGIIWIPASLALVALVAAGGPWGAFAISERSQLGQLRELMAQYPRLRNGKLDSAAQRVPNMSRPTKQRISSIFEYFSKRNALERLQPYFTASLAPPDSLQQLRSWQQRDWATDRLAGLSGIPIYNPYNLNESKELSVRFHTGRPEFQKLGGGRYWLSSISSYSYNEHDLNLEITAQEGIFRVRTENQGHDLWLEQQRADGTWQRQLSVDLGTVADSLARVHGRNRQQWVEVPNPTLTLRATTPRASLTVFLQEIMRRQRQDTASYDIEGQALLELRP
ncbi:DUF4153 domain-containing protein [Hymenobacter lucidus]|uniref:DUF4153 domain-containing protein n=1 Tax=Hymenobacter lucidus TaxID=2880930 RepID=A0ABS8ANI5_9BACT|nr:DUF4153 domain-containing protein [Hymenobacter lucidus]MCB2407753.1 DUF4153 domain-containing protein [Hymenobacter lucidus]